MYVCVCMYVRRPVAPSPAPAAVDLGRGGVRWWWRGGPCAFPLSLCVWRAAVVMCSGGGVGVSVLVVTIPQPKINDYKGVGIGRYTDSPSVGIELYRRTLSVAVTGVSIKLYRRMFSCNILYRQTLLYRPLFNCIAFIPTECLLSCFCTLTVEHDIIILNLESQMHQLSIHQQTIVDMLTIIIQDNNNCTIFYISIRQQFNRSTTVVQPQKSKHSSIRSHVWLTKWFISRNGSMPNNIQRNQYNVDLPAVNMPVAFHVHGPCNSSPSYLSPKCLLVLVESAESQELILSAYNKTGCK
jgi:hypothetical protein